MQFILKLLIGALLGILLLPYLVIFDSSPPKGSNLSSPYFSYTDAQLLVDRTYLKDSEESLYLDHQIFDYMIDEIKSAETFLILDFFLWNNWVGRFDRDILKKSIANRLSDALIAKRKARPDIPILMITDPINRLYNPFDSDYFKEFESLGIPVVFTDLKQLPDPNPLYSKQVRFWSKFFPSEAKENRFRFIPNTLNPNGEKLSLKQFWEAFHLKSNHRKVLISGYKNQASRLILGSFNPSDASALNSNIAALVVGPVADYAARSEMAIARWSTVDTSNLQGSTFLLLDTLNRLDQLIASEKEFDAFKSKNSGVRFLGEKQIKSTVLGLLKNAKENTEIDIAMFYLSDRKVIRAIKSALKKGAQIRLLLDQNLNAFGFKKNGIPNRAVADELMSLDASNALSVRWASADSGGQFHPKAFRLYDDKNDILIVGSANFTRRNINGFNLEACLLFNSVLSVSNKFDAYFDEVWTNSLGYSESLDYSELNNPKWMRWYRAVVFRIQEWTQLSTY